MKQKLLTLVVLSFFGFGLSAQTHYPVYNPTYNYTGAEDTNRNNVENLVQQWKVGLNAVKKQLNVSDVDFKAFTDFYVSYIDSERGAIHQLAQAGRINATGIVPYMNAKKQKLQALYKEFIQLKAANPNIIYDNYIRSDDGVQVPAATYTAPTCEAMCTNMDFSNGNLEDWACYYAADNSGSSYDITGIVGGPITTAVTSAANDPATGSKQIKLTNTGQNDWFLKKYHAIIMSQVSPWGTGHSVMLGDSIIDGAGVARICQKFNVTATTNSITYAYSVLLEDPPHPYYEQPFFNVTIFDAAGDTIKNCGVYSVVAQKGLDGFKGEYYSVNADTVYWKNWTQVNVPLNNYVGQCVTIQFEASDCEQGGHFGYAYIDASCQQLAITASEPVICGNGSIQLYGPGGEADYDWSGPAGGIIGTTTTQTVTVDDAGTYTCITTSVDGALCKDTIKYVVLKDLLSTTATHTNILCNGVDDGTITAAPSSGTAPYTYAWAPIGKTTESVSGLSAGSYTLSVSDANGCTATTATVVITQPTLLAVTTVMAEATCGNTNGTATATVTGGTVPYTYLWAASGETTAEATGLGAASYTVTVHDNNGCTATSVIAVTTTSGLSITTTANNVTCTALGSATVTASGGTPPYTYAWSPIGGSTTTATGLSAGTYTIVATQAGGCSQSATVIISPPTTITPTMGVPTNVLCNGGDNGSATVTVTGGALPYTYAWAPIGGSGVTGTGLTAGSYTVTVTTNSGCTGTASVTITQPTLLSATTTMNPATCGTSNGNATVTATGGTLPYAYAWANTGGNAATAPNLSAGSYTATVTDANGCTSTSVIVVTSIGGATVTIGVPTNVSCFGGDNGSATATAGGGAAPYTYAWTPNGGSTATGTGLIAGTYTVTVHDNTGCVSDATITITQPAQLTASISGLTYPLCNGGTGTATATATGGTVPYTYGWATNPPQATATANGLTAGTYTVGVIDNNGCTSSAIAVITQPTPVTASTVMTQATCGGTNGTATVTPGGGAGGYTYGWAPSVGAAATVNGLSAGTYTATVTDVNGCTATSSIVVTSTPPITISTTVVNNVSCFGGNNGSATATGAGGVNPYQYGWLTNPPQLTQTANGLSAGTYSVGTQDANGCQATTTVTITQPAAITTSTSFTPASCNLYNGSATVTVTGGGTAPFIYAWGTAPVQTTATAAGISAGTYTVLVTDNNGCTTTASVDVTQPSAVTAYICGTTGVSCFGGDNGTATACASGGTGPYGYVWSGPGGNAATGTGFSVGTYTVSAHDANGCISTITVTITQPAILVASISGPQILCLGSTGTFTANVSGGTAPYAYAWSSGAVGMTANITPAFAPQTYTVVVTDANGCTATAETTVNFGPPVSVVINGQTSVCPGGLATVCAIASGGTGGTDLYTWTSSTGDTYSTPCITVTPTITTTYTVVVMDNCGESATATTTINLNPYPIVNFYADLYQGCAPLCIEFYNTATLSSGVAQSYSWLFGDGDSAHTANPIYCYPNSGIYNVTLTVTSDSGCSATLKKSQMITVYPAPVAAFTMSPQPTTILNPTIQFTNESTGAYPISYWFWNFGDGYIDSLSNTNQNPTHTYGDTGTYCARLAVMDEHGCTDTTTNCLIIEPIFTLYIPSAFTPNGGGLNELFTAKGEYVKTFEMYIFDRWGEQLYHTTDINAGWDGTVKGGSTVSQEDVYVYKIIATDMENTPHNYIGSVTLIR